MSDQIKAALVNIQDFLFKKQTNTKLKLLIVSVINDLCENTFNKYVVSICEHSECYLSSSKRTLKGVSLFLTSCSLSFSPSGAVEVLGRKWLTVRSCDTPPSTHSSSPQAGCLSLLAQSLTLTWHSWNNYEPKTLLTANSPLPSMMCHPWLAWVLASSQPAGGREEEGEGIEGRNGKGWGGNGEMDKEKV